MRPHDFFYNLHTHTWSQKDRKNMRIIGHPKEAVVLEVCFIVGLKSNERVRREKRKNVHAFVRGTHGTEFARFLASSLVDDKWKEVTYNPYKHTSFMCQAEPVNRADAVLLKADRTVWALNPRNVKIGEQNATSSISCSHSRRGDEYSGGLKHQHC